MITDAEFSDHVTQLDAIYAGPLGRIAYAWHIDAIGLGRWTHDYTRLRDAGQSHAEAIAEVRRRIFAAVGQADPDTPAPPEPAPGGALPTLRARARWFWQDGADEPYDYREATAFMLFARFLRGEDITSRLAYWRAHGITSLRVLAMVGHPFWLGKGWDLRPSLPGYYEAWRPFMALLEAHGLYCRLSLFADRDYVAGLDTRHHARRMGETLAGCRNVIVEVANEPTMNGFRDPGELQALGHVYYTAGGWGPLALGPEHGPNGHRLTYQHAPADYLSFHAERMTSEDGWAWVRRLGEYGPALNPLGWPALSGEPINAGTRPDAPSDAEASTAIWYAYGALSRIVPERGYLPCFHFDRGLWADLPDAPAEACLAAFTAGCDDVPLHVRDRGWTNGQHSAAPFRGYAQTEDPMNDRPVRIYGRSEGADYVGLALRAPVGWRWPDLRYGVDMVKEISDRGWAAQLWKGK